MPGNRVLQSCVDALGWSRRYVFNDGGPVCCGLRMRDLLSSADRLVRSWLLESTERAVCRVLHQSSALAATLWLRVRMQADGRALRARCVRRVDAGVVIGNPEAQFSWSRDVVGSIGIDLGGA